MSAPCVYYAEGAIWWSPGDGRPSVRLTQASEPELTEASERLGIHAGILRVWVGVREDGAIPVVQGTFCVHDWRPRPQGRRWCASCGVTEVVP